MLTTDYVLPFGKYLHGFQGLVGKGWQFNTLLVREWGEPFTVTDSHYNPRLIQFALKYQF